MIVPLADIHRWAVDVFLSVGLSQDAAQTTVDNLTFAETRGVSSHGFMRVPIYVERIRAGGIHKDGVTRIRQDQGALVIADAGHAMGAISGADATKLAIERARVHGIGCVIVSNANHFGAAGYYTNLMADAGMFGFAACNTDRFMCAPFGGRRVLGTNPLSMAVPLARDERPQLDMATSDASLGKILAAAQGHREIPLGWAVDSHGNPTTTAADAVDGALLPSGGPKGFGLAFMIDALVALSGAKTSAQAGAMYGDATKPQELGLVFIAIQGGHGVSKEEYTRTIRQLVKDVHDSGPGPTGIPALAPGEPELTREREFSGDFEAVGELANELAAVAKLTGVPLPA